MLGHLLGMIMLTAQPSSDNFQIERWTVDSGGVALAVSPGFAASMTVGQADASGVSSSANFQLTSGFWTPLPPVAPRPDALFSDGFETVIPKLRMSP